MLADNPKYLMGLNATLLGIIIPFWYGRGLHPHSTCPWGCAHFSGNPEPVVSRCLRSRLKDTLINTIRHRATECALQLGLLLPLAEALHMGMVDQVYLRTKC